MIIEYHRPENLEQAKRLLNRESPMTIPLGGGSVVSRYTDRPIAVVDLQSLGLNKITVEKTSCRIGAMVRLQDLVECPNIPEGLAIAARRETNINMRRTATVGGVLMTSDGTSPLLGMLMALDVKIIWESGNKSLFLGEWLLKDRQKNPGKLITSIEFTVPIDTKYEDVARSPEDRPIVYVCTAKWETGDHRIVMGGSGKAPILATEESKNIVSGIVNRLTHTSTKEKSSYTEYQQAAIKTLIDRLFPEKVNNGGKGLL
jgi:CO/xanthine dehydrogenase FAD-binding subunit